MPRQRAGMAQNRYGQGAFTRVNAEVDEGYARSSSATRCSPWPLRMLGCMAKPMQQSTFGSSQKTIDKADQNEEPMEAQGSPESTGAKRNSQGAA